MAPILINAGQRTDLLHELRRCLDNYDDSQIIAELLQNADDAKATCFSILFDKRLHGSSSLFGKGMASLQGPALLAFDNAGMDTFDGLLSFGKGSKRCDPTATGKFGLGFSSVYHICDCPIILSKGMMQVLDPTKSHFPDLLDDPTLDPGMRCDIQTIPKGELHDQIEPFRLNCFGIDNPRRPHKSTVIRLALRSREAAQHSKLIAKPYTIAAAQNLIQSAVSHLPSLLLFLTHIRRAEIWEWKSGEESPRLLRRVDLQGKDLFYRSEHGEWLRRRLEEYGRRERIDWRHCPDALPRLLSQLNPADVPRRTIHLRIQDHLNSSKSEDWIIRTGVGYGESWKLASIYDGERAPLWPLGAVAAPLSNVTQAGGMYATLPLPINSGLPIQVNARWALDDSRRTIKFGDVSAGLRKLVQWNMSLLTDALPSLYVELLEELRPTKHTHEILSRFYSLWPRVDSYGDSLLFQKLSMSVLRDLTSRKVFSTVDGSWRIARDVRFRPEFFVVDSFAPPVNRSSTKLRGLPLWRRASHRVVLLAKFKGCIGQTIVKDGCPWICNAQDAVFRNFELGVSIAQSLNDSKTAIALQNLQRLSPADARHYYKNGKDSSGNFPCIKNSPQLAAKMLAFCVSDILVNEGHSKDMRIIEGLLCPNVNGKLIKIGRASAPLIVSDFPILSNMILHDGPSRERLVHAAASSCLNRLFARHQNLDGDYPNQDLASSNSKFLEKMSHTNIIQHMIEVFPDMNGAAAIPSTWEPLVSSRPSKIWLRALWTFIMASDPELSLERFQAWPIIPCDDGSLLVSPRLRLCILSPALGQDSSSLTDCHSLYTILSLCRCAGLHLVYENSDLCPSGSLPKFASLSPSSAVVALHYGLLEGILSIHGLKPEEKDILLNFLSNCTDNLDDKLRTLPLFKTLKGDYVSLEAGQLWYTLPTEMQNDSATIQKCDINLLTKPSSNSLQVMYQTRLGIQPLPYASYWKSVIFPKLESASTAERLSYLEILRAMYEELCHQDKNFARVVADACIVENIRGASVKTIDVADPEEPFFVEFLKENLPAPQYNKHLPLLRRIGIKSTVDASTFLRIAKHVAEILKQGSSSHDECCRKSRIILEFLCRNHATMLDDKSDIAKRKFYEDIASLSLIEWRKPYVTNEHLRYDVSNCFFPLSSVCRADYYDLIWSQMPSMKTASHLPTSLCSLLKMRKPQIADVARHLLFLSELSVGTFGRLIKQKNMRESLYSIYSALAANLEDNAIRLLLGKRVILLDTVELDGRNSISFVEPERIFFGLKHEVAPHAYSVADAHLAIRGQSRLLTALGVTDDPLPTNVCTWLQELYETSNAPVHTAISLLMLLVESSVDGAAQILAMDLLIPDSDGIFVKSIEVFLDDAPWLKDRILSVRLAHPQIPFKVATDLGIRRLSDAVQERLSPDMEQPKPDTQQHPLIEQWSRNLSSLHFRNAVRQLMLHESAGQSEIPPQLNSKFCALTSTNIVGVPQIMSQFILASEAGEMDITLCPNGSPSLIHEKNDGSCIIVVETGSGDHSRWLLSLVLCIARFLGGYISNLHPIEKLLSVKEPSQMKDILLLFQITLPPSGLDSHLGTELSVAEAARCIPCADISNLFPGDEIAFLPSTTTNPGQIAAGARIFRYGRIAAILPSSNVEIEIGSGESKIFSIESIFKCVSIFDARRKVINQAEALIGENDIALLEDEPFTPNGGVNGQADGNYSDDEEPIDVFHTQDSLSRSKDNTMPVHENVKEMYEYRPPQTNWAETEERLVQKLREKMNSVESLLEEEAPGVDELLVQGGWKIGAGANAVETKTKARVGRRIRKGYDIVRIGNFDGDIAFFHMRNSSFTETRRQLLIDLIPPLREVCAVFEYDPAFVTLFWHPESASRFIQQRLLLNIWPVEQQIEANARKRLRSPAVYRDPYVYAYFYGLLIHKLGHFHDIVHGTRHDFYMNEIRIEFLEGWLSLLERKAIETKDDRFLPHNVMRTYNTLLCDTVN